ncbi:MAG TPA: tRNA pseudouridine(55) synthase TruB [Geobacteraceae bacterium]
MDGFLVIDKPCGITSHDVVQRVRRLCQQKKAGHTGTLDPFATGVLPIALGQGTKAIPFLDERVKEYRATMRLGSATDTQDCSGQLLWSGEWQHLSPEAIRLVTADFTGSLHQIPPMFSALKRDGTPLYCLARAGITVEREARAIHVYDLQVLSIDLPEVTFTIRCSRGTYVRTIAHDIGEKLGCGAHLVQLCRLASGPFTLADAVSLESLAEMAASNEIVGSLVSPYQALCHLPALELTQRGSQKIGHGIAPLLEDIVDCGPLPNTGTRVRLASSASLAAVAEVVEGPSLRLLRVFS